MKCTLYSRLIVGGEPSRAKPRKKMNVDVMEEKGDEDGGVAEKPEDQEQKKKSEPKKISFLSKEEREKEKLEKLKRESEVCRYSPFSL